MNWKTALVLTIVGFVAVFIRIYPTMGNFAFGNDFGIYSTIARDFLNSGRIFETFRSPWGGAGYGDFPVMYWIVLGLSRISGLNYATLLVKVPPVFGGLCSIIVYFIAYRLTKNSLVSCLAAMFDAVNPVIAYQTSISSILVFGHFFGLLSVLFFISYLDDRRYFLPFLGAGILMVLSHPLSTFMYLLAILGITLAYLARRQSLGERLKLAAAIYPLSTFIFAYWFLFFKGFSSFMSGGVLHLPASLIIFAYYAVVTLLLFFPIERLLKLRQNSRNDPVSNNNLWLYLSMAAYATVSTAAIIIILDLVPGLSPVDVLSFIPLILDGALAIMGMYFARGTLRQITAGWIFLMGLALLYSVVTWNMVLYPGRYIEYLFEPLSILEAVGTVSLFNLFMKNHYKDHPHSSIFRRSKLIITVKGQRTVFGMLKRSALNFLESMGGRYNRTSAFGVLLLLFVLIAASAATPYQVGNMVTPSGNQAISLPDYEAAKWLQYNADRNYSVATDHILGLMVDSYNLSGAFEDINQTWTETGFGNQTLHELLGREYSPSQNYSPVGYIFIDNYMLSQGVWGYGGLSNPYHKPIKMTNQSFLKFLYPPFVPVYFNNTTGNTWSLVIQVNWTWINSEYGTDVSVANLTMLQPATTASYLVNATLVNTKH